MIQEMTAVLFADLAGFTALTEAHGDQGAAEIAGRFHDLTSAALIDDARMVKNDRGSGDVASDGVLAVARTALALASVVEVESLFPGMRSGLHAGEVIERSGDLFGAAVNLAARLAAYAELGQVVCTQEIALAISEAPDLAATPAGRAVLRNVREPIAIYLLADARQRTGPPSDVDPVCRMRVPQDGGVGTLVHAGRQRRFCSLDCVRAFVADLDAYAASADQTPSQ